MKQLFAALISLILIFSLPIGVLATDATDTAAVTDSVSEAVTEAVTSDETTAETETEAEQKTVFGFFPESLSTTLPLMGMGMLGIFLVTLTIILTVLILRWLGDKMDKKNEN